jgi:threonine synthase
LKQEVKYYSTNGRSEGVSFREALLKGLAPDGGLYIPDPLPVFSPDELRSFAGLGYHHIAAHVVGKFCSDDIGSHEIHQISRDAYNFDVPIEHVSDNRFILRLDQGPTASFKDFAARMMSRLMQHFLAESNRQLTILTATSGDTGSAVANAFYGLGNIKVMILFPKDEVTDLQRKQMTTLQKNISVYAVDGKFDDCQDLVKKAFTDGSLSHLPLTSANSINIGRLIPQTIYYFYAWSRLAASKDSKIIFSVPSGNFGNLTAGLIAMKMGLPVEKFILATNMNDEVPEFLQSGIYKPLVPSRNCISSAMNVGHPSNLARMIMLYGGAMNEKGVISRQPDLDKMKNDLYGISVTDDETSETIFSEYTKNGLLLEPHGAVAWFGLNEYLKDHPADGITSYVSVETAHPAKFSREMRHILNIDPPVPVSLQRLEEKEEKYIEISKDYKSFKEKVLLNN